MPSNNPFEEFDNIPTIDSAYRQSMAYGVQQDPNKYSADMQTAQQFGSSDPAMAPHFEVAKRLSSTMPISAMQGYPKTTQFFSDPHRAAMAWDDFHGVRAMEELSNQFRIDNLTPSQTQAVLADRAKRTFNNAQVGELESVTAELSRNILGPAVRTVNRAAQTGLASLDYIGSKLGQTVGEASQAERYRSNILNDTSASKLAQGYQSQVGSRLENVVNGRVKLQPDEYLIDPATGKPFKNPDYNGITGRTVANTLIGMAGTAAQFATGSEVATGLAQFCMASDAAFGSYDRAAAEGDNEYLAAAKGLGVGGLNVGLFGLGGHVAPGAMSKVLPSVARYESPYTSRLASLADPLWEATKRGVGLAAGMTTGEELIQHINDLGSTDPMETVKGFGSRLANFTAFELGGAIMPAINNYRYLKAMRNEVEGLATRARNTELFKQMVEDTTDGQSVLISKGDIDTYCQEAGIKVPEILSAFNLKDQYDRATANENLKVKLSDYYAYTGEKSKETMDRLDRLVKTEDGQATMSAIGKMVDQKFASEMRWALRMGFEVAKPAEPTDAYTEIHDRWKAWLQPWFNDSTAETYATWHAATMNSIGERAGVDPREIDARFRGVNYADERAANAGADGSFDQEVPGGPRLRANGSRIGSDPSLQRLLESYARSDGEVRGAVPGTVEGSEPRVTRLYSGDVTGLPVQAAGYDNGHVMVGGFGPGMPYVTGTVEGNLFHVGEMSGENNKGVGYDLYSALGQYLQENHPEVTHVIGLAGGTAEDPEGIVRLRNAFHDTQWAGTDVTNRWAGTPVQSLAEGPSWRNNDPRELQRRTADRRFQEETHGFTPTTAARSSWAFDRRRGRNGSGDGVRSIQGVPVLESWSLDRDHRELLQRLGISAPDVHELDYNDPLAAGVFREAIAKTRENNKYAASVHVYDEGDYRAARLFLTEDSHAGFALKPDGDIISVFSHQTPEVKGAAHEMLEIAKLCGGSKLDCFDTILPALYSEHGFAVQARMTWDDQYAPTDWDFDTFAKFNEGRPDVVFMALNNALPVYDKTQGTRTSDYEEALRMQRRGQIIGGAKLIEKPEEVFAQAMSTRKPEGQGAVEDYMKEILITNLDSQRLNPVAFEKSVVLMESFLGVPQPEKGASIEQRSENIINHMMNNLLWLHGKMPAELRDHAKLWYVGAEALAEKWCADHNISKMQLASMMACLSPQTDWFQNVSFTQRILDVLKDQQNHRWDDEMERFAQRKSKLADWDLVRGKTFAECPTEKEKAIWFRAYDAAHNPTNFRSIHPDGTFGDFVVHTDGVTRSAVQWGGFDRIEKAIASYYNGDASNISEQLGNGHKVRNFYNNIFNPASDKFVTIDTHAVAAALLRPLAGGDAEVQANLNGSPDSKSTGMYGTYGLIAEAYIRAAAQANILPREMQSITWEAIRAMLPAGYKRSQSGPFNRFEGNVDKAITGEINKVTKKPVLFKDLLEQLKTAGADPKTLTLWRKIAKAKGEDKEMLKQGLEAVKPLLEGGIDGVWRQVKEGKLGVEEAREQVLELAKKWRGDDKDIGKIAWEGYQHRENSMEGSTYKQAVYHGSPYRFDEFSLEHLGKGEGAQAFGWGLYFAGDKAVAEHYRQLLAGNQFTYRGEVLKRGSDIATAAELLHKAQGDVEKAKDAAMDMPLTAWSKMTVLAEIGRLNYADIKAGGQLYKVDIPDEGYLDWDKPLSQQPQAVQGYLSSLPTKAGSTVMPNGERAYDGFMDRYTGRDLYQILQEAHGADARAASMTLKAAGLSGIKYLDGMSRDEGEGSHNYVLFDDNAAKIVDTYYQAKPDGIRGQIHFGPDNSISIDLFKQANLSTLVHELSHAYFRIYGDLVAEGKLTGDDAARYHKMLDWLGAKPGEKLTVEQVEKMARAEEQWLHEGKAPSPDLAPVFSRMALWMQKVYGAVAAYSDQQDREGRSLRVEINKDVADFFARLHATDKAVDEMKDFAPMFVTAKDMGVSEKVFDAYVKLAGKVTDTAKQELLQKALAQGDRRLKSWWKDEEAKVREEVVPQVDASPIMRTLKALKDGEVELPGGGKMEVLLSRPALLAKYGEDFVKNLSNKIQRHISNVGADPDSLAELLGYQDGETMLKEVMAAPRRNDVINEAVARTMAERHGDLLRDGTVADEAMRLLHGDDRSQLIQRELAILEAQRRKAKTLNDVRLQEMKANLKDVETLHKEQEANRANEEKVKARVQAKVNAEEIKEALDSLPDLKSVQAKAAADISSMTLRNMRPNQFLSTARRASRKSMTQAMKGDYEGAVAAQQEYLTNHFRYVEACKQRDNAMGMVAYLRGLQGKDAQMDLGKAGGSYREQVNDLLAQVGLRSISAQQVEKNQSLSDWAAEMEARGQLPFVDPKLLTDARKKNYADMTLSEFKDLHDTVKSIAHLAGQELSLIVGDRKAAFADAVSEAASTAAPRKFPDDKRTGGETSGKIGHFFRSFDAMAVKMSTLVDKLDGGDVNGIWRRSMLDPIRHATNEWHRLTDEYVAAMAEKMAMSKDMTKSLTDKVTLPSGETINRNQLLAILLNCGNAENRSMLQNKEAGNFDPKDIEAALRMATPQEAKFVQGVWDVLDSLRPKIGELEKRMNGIEPEWVEKAPVTMGGVQLEGGYYPLVADRRMGGGPRMDMDVARLFESGYSGVGTIHGFTKDRTGKQYKLDLDWHNIVTAHLNAVVKDLAFREAVVSVNKFITNDVVRQTVRECLGREYEDQLTPWLRSIVNDQNGNKLQGTSGVDTFVNRARGHAVSMMIAYKVASTAVQIADMTRVLPLVNTYHLARGFAAYAAHPFETYDFITRNSELMQHRSENLDRDIREKMHQMIGDASSKATMQRWGFKGFGLVDRQISSIAWMGAYNEGMAKTGDHAQAVRLADRVIENGLQSGEAMDLVAMQRNHPITKMFTMFCGDNIAAYNLCRVLGQNITDPGSAMRFAAGFVLSTAVANLIADWVSGRKPADDQDPAVWYAAQAALSPFRMVPIVKDVMSTWDARVFGGGGIDYRWSPLLSAFEKTADGLYAQKKFFVDNDEDFDQWLKDSATAVGYLYGVPGGSQAINTTSYLHGVAAGDITPTDPFNFAAGAIIGGRK